MSVIFKLENLQMDIDVIDIDCKASDEISSIGSLKNYTQIGKHLTLCKLAISVENMQAWI